MTEKLNIVQSTTEPDKRNIWLKDNELKKFGAKGWSTIGGSNAGTDHEESIAQINIKLSEHTASISENKIAIEKNTSDIKNVSDTVDAQAARLDDVDTTLENALFKNKGYFTTEAKLKEAIPNPTIGSKAYVGTSEPYAIYIVENGAWVDSGYTGGNELVAKITTDRIENGAVTSEKIATSAFDLTLSVSGKIAPADVVGGKLTKLEDLTKLYSITYTGTNLDLSSTGCAVQQGKSYKIHINTSDTFVKYISLSIYNPTNSKYQLIADITPSQLSKSPEYVATPTFDGDVYIRLRDSADISKNISIDITEQKKYSVAVNERNISRIEDEMTHINDNIAHNSENIESIEREIAPIIMLGRVQHIFSGDTLEETGIAISSNVNYTFVLHGNVSNIIRIAAYNPSVSGSYVVIGVYSKENIASGVSVTYRSDFDTYLYIRANDITQTGEQVEIAFGKTFDVNTIATSTLENITEIEDSKGRLNIIEHEDAIYNNFLPNPLNSVVSRRKELCDCDFAENNKYESITDCFKFIYLYQVLTEGAISESGILNNTVIKDNIRTVLDENVSKNKRAIIRVFPELETDSAEHLWNYQYNGEDCYTHIDPVIVDILNRLGDYLIAVSMPTRAIYQGKKVVMLDFSKTKVKNLYSNLFSVLREVLQENVVSTKSILYRDYFPVIEFGFVGAWGENRLDNFGGWFTSDDLIDIVELYKRHFYDFTLIAPMIVMSSTYTTEDYYKYSYYLAVTKYGNNTSNADGTYTGNKMFGWYRDSLTGNILENDKYDIIYNGVELREYVFNRYLNAPVIGEASTGGILNPEWLMDNVKKYHIAYYKHYSSQPKYGDYGVNIAKKAFNLCGYRLMMKWRNISVSNNSISGYIRFVNLGVTKCYDDYWQLKIIIRDKNGNFIRDFALPHTISDISESPTSGNIYGETYNVNISLDISSLNMQKKDINVFLCIIDSKQIDSPMFLANYGRNKMGEYCLYSSEYNIEYYNVLPDEHTNPALKSLCDDVKLKDAHRDGFVFDGWYMAKSENEGNTYNCVKVDSITSNDYGFNGKIKLFAKFHQEVQEVFVG